MYDVFEEQTTLDILEQKEEASGEEGGICPCVGVRHPPLGGPAPRCCERLRTALVLYCFVPHEGNVYDVGIINVLLQNI